MRQYVQKGGHEQLIRSYLESANGDREVLPGLRTRSSPSADVHAATSDRRDGLAFYCREHLADGAAAVGGAHATGPAQDPSRPRRVDVRRAHKWCPDCGQREAARRILRRHGVGTRARAPTASPATTRGVRASRRGGRIADLSPDAPVRHHGDGSRRDARGRRAGCCAICERRPPRTSTMITRPARSERCCASTATAVSASSRTTPRCCTRRPTTSTGSTPRSAAVAAELAAAGVGAPEACRPPGGAAGRVAATPRHARHQHAEHRADQQVHAGGSRRERRMR